MAIVFTIGVLALIALVLAAPTHGFHRRRSAWGRLEFIDLDKYFMLRCQGGQGFSGAYDDFASVFRYGKSIIAYAKDNCMSLAGYRGTHYAPYIIIDLDGPEAFGHARILYRFLAENLAIPVGAILIFFSGSRGIHIYIKTAIVGAEPSDYFYLYAKEFCHRLAEAAGVIIDMAVYGPLQLVRSPNAKHSGSGLYKILLLSEELFEMEWEGMREMARQPRNCELPPSSNTALPELTKRWGDSVLAVNASMKKRGAVKTISIASGSTSRVPVLSGSENGVHPYLDNFQVYKRTRDFLLNGAPKGTRHPRLVAAAKNFADFGPGAKGIAYALLFPVAFLSDMPEREIVNVIEDAFKERG